MSAVLLFAVGAQMAALPAPPENDAFAGRLVLTGLTADAGGEISEATLEDGEQPPPGAAAGKSLWWSWTAPSNCLVTISTASNTFGLGYDESILKGPAYLEGPLVTVYTGSGIEDLTLIAGNNVQRYLGYPHPIYPGPWVVYTNCTFDATEGTTYQIRLDGWNGYVGNFVFSLNAWVPSPPPNDNFADGMPLTGDETSLLSHNRFATAERDEPGDPIWPPQSSLWWKWTAPASGFAELRVQERDFPPTIDVFTGDTLQTLSLLQVGTTSLVFRAVMGATYNIRVYNLNETPAGSAFITLQLHRSPSNDDFANSVNVAGTNVMAPGSNFYATLEPNEPTPQWGLGYSVWFTWTAPHTGNAMVTLGDGSRALPFAVYTGSNLSNLLQVAAAPDADRYYIANFSATKGTTYHVALYGDLFIAEQGAFVLRIIAPPPSPPTLDPAGSMLLSNSQFKLIVNGWRDEIFTLEASTNLIDWAAIHTDVFRSNTFEFVDADATSYSRRFYRVLTAP